MEHAEPILSSLYVPVCDGLLLCDAGGVWHPLSYKELRASGLAVLSEHDAGSLGEHEYKAVDVALGESGDLSYQWLGLRSQLGIIHENQFLLAGKCLQIIRWHQEHRFCGRCGRATQDFGSERAKVCTACELHFYPRISPCVIVLITRGDKCLLARHARSKYDIYTALAGFVEAGERLEDTLHREILEEVGVRVKHPVYFSSQPWPFPNQLMLGFHVEYDSGEIAVDGEEIIDARWYRFDQLPQVPPITTLSGQLIHHFVEQQKLHLKVDV